MIPKNEAEAAFARVANKSDWRAPIDAVVVGTWEEMKKIAEAVAFFTATEAKVETITPGNHGGPRAFRVRSVGYRMGPAGP